MRVTELVEPAEDLVEQLDEPGRREPRRERREADDAGEDDGHLGEGVGERAFVRLERG